MREQHQGCGSTPAIQEQTWKWSVTGSNSHQTRDISGKRRGTRPVLHKLSYFSASYKYKASGSWPHPGPQELQVQHRLYGSRYIVKGGEQTLVCEQAQTDPISAGILTAPTLHEVQSILFIPLCSF